MIEDKKLGLKIAESHEEALWTRVKNAREQQIKDLEDSLIIEKAILELTKSKLKNVTKK